MPSANTRPRFTLGPGILVTAAFVGPGTVTACTVAGAQFGTALVWALIFSTLATIVLQDMAARLGVGARLGLGEALVRGFKAPFVRFGIMGLMLTGLAIGNAAYEAGNLSGASLGADLLFDGAGGARGISLVILGVLAGGLLLYGRYQTLERILTGLVLVMSLAFIATALLAPPDLGTFFAGFVPAIPDGGLLTTVALIGTTVVPYNLFLHAAAARERWPEGSSDALAQARWDTRLSIGLGGLISIAILSAAASSLFTQGLEVRGAADLAKALEPVFGAGAPLLVGGGLMAAGLTSAITAPLATAYAVREILPIQAGQEIWFRGVALAVLVTGLAVASLDVNVIHLIVLAQVANGLLLPIVAAFLLWTMNRTELLGAHVNGWLSNFLGLGVVVITFALGLRSILRGVGLI